MPSSVVAEIIYDAEKQILRIRFVSGLVYDYINVPEDVYRQMMQSGARGIFLNTKIKGHYSYRKVKSS